MLVLYVGGTVCRCMLVLYMYTYILYLVHVYVCIRVQYRHIIMYLAFLYKTLAQEAKSAVKFAMVLIEANTCIKFQEIMCPRSISQHYIKFALVQYQ